jgi:hypothetical protein
MKCVVIDSDGKVVNSIVADPDVDTLEGFTLKWAPDEVTKGYVWNRENFMPSAELQKTLDEKEAAIYEAILQEALK